ncbi:MAG: glycoside hydrolase family 3 C-terminal domain-containing protein [Fimbriimonas sp.]|nr:glycoside hydrolase family 3 C-terminal domain-containing protein [Fimbriimonas sp.]
MRTVVTVALLSAVSGLAFAQGPGRPGSGPTVTPEQFTAAQKQPYPFRNLRLSPEVRITDLLSRLTLNEKIGLLGFADLRRLGIRLSGSIEGIHGVAQDGPANWLPRHRVQTTVFPQGYGLGETWDPDLLKRVGHVEGYEARYIWQNPDIQQAAVIAFTPNADLARDPRWGRTEESYGEDPFLVGSLVAGMVRGLQGDDKRYWQCASLMKHFLANSNEDTREHSSSNFDERQLREYYSVGFRMGVEAGSRAFMAAYNAVNGVPCAIDTSILRGMAVNDWGQDGIICTDGGAYRLLMTAHKVTSSPSQAAALCIKAGITRFLDNYFAGVQGALKEGLITESDIDEADRRNLRVQVKLGTLDPADSPNPYRTIGKGPAPWLSNEHIQIARQAADESVVLLKNDGILPLDKSKLKRVAVVGSRSNEVIFDWYSGKPPHAVTALEGIKTKLGDGVQIATALGGEDAVAAAKEADVAIVVVGNHPNGGENMKWAQAEKPSYGREGLDRKSIDLEDEELVKQVLAVNPHTVLVLVSSFPYAINWSQEHVPGIVHLTQSCEELGDGLADVLFGDFNPAGRTSQTWVRSLDDLPPMEDYDLTHGRTYMYFKGQPLYPFGFGLSYSKFAYQNLSLSRKAISINQTVRVTVRVRNTSSRDGEEVVQLYASYPDSKVYRPIKQLRAFKRVAIKAGKTATVRLDVAAKDLSYWNANEHVWTLEPGSVTFTAGPNSADAAVSARLTIRN